ncbi:uncharacterized protein A4U43_UnF8930 [Asparagus officinalis]|uniref:Uncharacterized protein n=1 Tax=Asparagus officinalis TaxID=4686 RepID=A0A1R3L5U5_ASPOF|nr:uncharacterized protein A4U43_UnF8930 [Asparagus officinalis]
MSNSGISTSTMHMETSHIDLNDLKVGLLYDEVALQNVLNMTADGTKEEREMWRRKMSAVDAPFIEVLDIFETGGTGGMSKDSVNKLEKSKISKQNNGDDFGEKICYLFAFREPTHVYLHARAAKEGSFKGKDGMKCDESRNRSALGIVVNVFL